MSFIATSVSQGLSTYAASLWVQNLHSVMGKLFPRDEDNVIHTILYAILLTFVIVIFTWMIDKYVRRDDNK